MLNYLQARIIELDQPVGKPKITNWKLPSKDYSYGMSGRQIEEGVSTITRSWIIHQPSKTSQPPQDYVRINKLAIKRNAVNYSTNKDFRDSIDIKQKIKIGSKIKNVKLPPCEFFYGMKSGTPAPVKDIINNEYGRKAEMEIKSNYNEFIKKKRQMSSQSLPGNNKQIGRLIQLRRSAQNILDKPLYKHKMFRNVKSKVSENLKSFKTYCPDEGKHHLDKLIDQVQKEMKSKEV